MCSTVHQYPSAMPTVRTLLLGLLLTTGALHAQDRTLVRSIFTAPGDTITGGYIAISGNAGNVMGNDAFLLGTRGGVTVGGWITFGLMGNWLTTGVRNTAYERYREDQGHAPQDGLRFNAGYGGLLIEPVIFNRSMVHLAFPIAFGAGGASYSYLRDNTQTFRRIRPDAVTFYFVQPAAELEVNIIDNLRIGVGASYLYTSDIVLPETGRDILRQPMFQFTLKVGQF